MICGSIIVKSAKYLIKAEIVWKSRIRLYVYSPHTGKPKKHEEDCKDIIRTDDMYSLHETDDSCQVCRFCEGQVRVCYLILP